MGQQLPLRAGAVGDDVVVLPERVRGRGRNSILLTGNLSEWLHCGVFTDRCAVGDGDRDGVHMLSDVSSISDSLLLSE